MINEILEAVKSASHPVARAMHSGAHFKVLAIAFKKGMELKNHKTSLPAVLTVLDGEVMYIDGAKKVILKQYDSIHIEVDVIHAVQCIDDALCILSQGE